MSHKVNDEVMEMIEEGNWGDDFENYLQEKHAKGYMGTDDNMPDAYESWLENWTPEELYQEFINFNS